MNIQYFILGMIILWLAVRNGQLTSQLSLQKRPIVRRCNCQDRALKKNLGDAAE